MATTLMTDVLAPRTSASIDRVRAAGGMRAGRVP
jgi:hypothetical protein